MSSPYYEPHRTGPPSDAEPWSVSPQGSSPLPSATYQQPPRRSVTVPLLLYLATCWTTSAIGPVYAAAVMGILTCHEFGHYLQARRYRVPASLPYFIPMPGSPLGTMGAVIAMRGNIGNRKALFDIGISGPLAGLVPALACSIIGLQWSKIVTGVQEYGEPLLFQFLIQSFLGPVAEGSKVEFHPLAYAGWVGIFVTAVNLFPIGQLDGGHVLYAILRKKAHWVASALLVGAIGVVILTNTYQWLLMLMLLVLIGPNHPPTADDDMPLGRGRIILGWLTLAFVIIGFTPRPFF